MSKNKATNQLFLFALAYRSKKNKRKSFISLETCFLRDCWLLIENNSLPLQPKLFFILHVKQFDRKEVFSWFSNISSGSLIYRHKLMSSEILLRSGSVLLLLLLFRLRYNRERVVRSKVLLVLLLSFDSW